MFSRIARVVRSLLSGQSPDGPFNRSDGRSVADWYSPADSVPPMPTEKLRQPNSNIIFTEYRPEPLERAGRVSLVDEPIPLVPDTSERRTTR